MNQSFFFKKLQDRGTDRVSPVSPLTYSSDPQPVFSRTLLSVLVSFSIRALDSGSVFNFQPGSLV